MIKNIVCFLVLMSTNAFAQGYSINQGFVQPIEGSYLFEAPKDSFDVRVYPNPFVESFTASFEKEFSSINVIIQNTLGQTIYQKDFSNQSEIGVELQNLS